ncbi:tryptophan-rich sensory protein [Sphingomonas sp. GlSt437]|uniref:tryptophan-rich sensory protein n=1 Tax=Sphingomonas sp. GlSt437 TaxID=3389970 RepID=UPI003A892D7D
MFTVGFLNRRDRLGLLANIVAPIALAAALNALIFGLGWNQPTHGDHDAIAPPPWVIGLIWIVLFALLGVARWLLVLSSRVDVENAIRGRSISQAFASLHILIVMSAAYVFYAILPGSAVAGLIGNAITLGLAVVAVDRAIAVSRVAAVLIAPTVIWLAFATLLFFLDPAAQQIVSVSVSIS